MVISLSKGGLAILHQPPDFALTGQRNTSYGALLELWQGAFRQLAQEPYCLSWIKQVIPPSADYMRGCSPGNRFLVSLSLLAVCDQPPKRLDYWP